MFLSCFVHTVKIIFCFESKNFTFVSTEQATENSSIGLHFVKDGIRFAQFWPSVGRVNEKAKRLAILVAFSETWIDYLNTSLH